MKKIVTFILLFVSISIVTNAQTIKIDPYLQNAQPTSMYIMWETTSGSQSIVEWGTSTALGNVTDGTSEISEGVNRIHTVQLTGLTKFTKYYYRVKTGGAVSSIKNFRTPPFASDHESFTIVAMSDMQEGSDGEKFGEVIHDGVLDYFSEEFGGEIYDNLALVIIPGDLVDDGTNYASWKNEFFDFSTDLFGQVPVYPVPGNHENDSPNFFKYFNLPTNGTAGFEEHWWHTDYGNVRIIGFDSNWPYYQAQEQEQLNWLNALLDETSNDPNIDFVFAQLHHPHQSELWTPGESNFTGLIEEALGQFTTASGKPSIHFFGHTHAYSRGNLRDHKHMMVNVASASGDIDYWGQYANYDYDEYSKSIDEFGFVTLEITDDDDPKVVLKRLSRGDNFIAKDNELIDEMVIRLNPTAINAPSPIYPNGETGLHTECVTLRANEFSSPSANAVHGQTHWQVSTSANFDTEVIDSWKNYENWYNEIDTQYGDDLTDEKIEGLTPSTNYWWRVRYRDRELNWSPWSIAGTFSTGDSGFSDNLVSNPGAENQLVGWTTSQGVVETVVDYECDGLTAHNGLRYFVVGGICQNSEVGICYQNVNVSSYATPIDQGNYVVSFGGFLRDYGGADKPEIRVIFYNAANQELGSSDYLSSLSVSWIYKNEEILIPTQTRTIRIELKGTRFSGEDNDSYIDDVFLRVGGNAGVNCGAESVTLDLNVFLQGAYDTISNLMRDDLREFNMLPTMEPYTQLGYLQVGGGGEQVNASVYTVANANAIVDWVLVELRDGSDFNNVIATQSALLQSDGDIVDVDGVSNIVFDNMSEVSSAYVVVKHRNHFGVGTANPQFLDQPINIDFTSPNTPVYGTGSMTLIDGKMMLKVGDASRDGVINTIDKNDYWRPQNAHPYGYIQSSSDFNLDGSVNGVDKNGNLRINNPSVGPMLTSNFAKIVSVTQNGDPGNYNFQVGISSPDTGCDQYADWWEILTPDGVLLYRRVLGHSHVNDQPFIRSGGPVNIQSFQTVIIRAHMNNNGYGTQAFIGSVVAGFNSYYTEDGFAGELENQGAQPPTCQF